MSRLPIPGGIQVPGLTKGARDNVELVLETITLSDAATP